MYLSLSPRLLLRYVSTEGAELHTKSSSEKIARTNGRKLQQEGLELEFGCAVKSSCVILC